MAPDRNAQWTAYVRLAPAARRSLIEKGSGHTTSELVSTWLGDGNYVARDVLIARGVFPDTANCALNDYGHYVLETTLGASRIQLAPMRGRQRLSGAVVPGAGRAHITTRRLSETTTTLNVGRPSASNVLNLDSIVTMLFAPDFSVLEAWALPLAVLEELGVKTRLRRGGPWTSHPAVRRLDLGEKTAQVSA
jgi:hypothetical protein